MCRAIRWTGRLLTIWACLESCRAAVAGELSAWAPGTDRLLVLRTVLRELMLLDTATDTIAKTVSLDAAPAAVAAANGVAYVAMPERIQPFSLPALTPRPPWPVSGIRFLEYDEASRGLIGVNAAGELLVIEPEPLKIRTRNPLATDRDSSSLDRSMAAATRQVVRCLRLDPRNRRAHLVLGAPLGEWLYQEPVKPTDTWVVVDLAQGRLEKRFPVLAPCEDICVDTAAGKAYGLSRSFNADHMVVLDSASLALGPCIPLEPFEVQNQDRVSLAPNGLLALFSTWNPEDLVLVRAAPRFQSGLPPVLTRPEGLAGVSAGELKAAFARIRNERKNVVAHTVALWGLRGPYGRILMEPGRGTFYLPGQRGVVKIEKATVEALVKATLPPTRFFIERGVPDPRATSEHANFLPFVGEADHNTLAPKKPLAFEAIAKASPDAFLIQEYVIPDPMGIFKIDVGQLTIRKDRPRICITPQEVPRLREKCTGPLRREFEIARDWLLKRGCATVDARTIASEKAAMIGLCYLVTEDLRFLEKARAIFRAAMGSPAGWKLGGNGDESFSPALVLYDWCYSGFTPHERREFGEFLWRKYREYPYMPELFEKPEWGKWGKGAFPWHNWTLPHCFHELLAAVLLAGEPWLDETQFQAAVRRGTHWFRVGMGANEETAWDGGQIEGGYSYSQMDLSSPVAAAAILRSATGQDWFQQLGFLKHTDAWILYGLRPDLKLTKRSDSWFRQEFGHNGVFPADGLQAFSTSILAAAYQCPLFYWASQKRQRDVICPGLFYYLYVDPGNQGSDPLVEPYLRPGDHLPLARLFHGVGIAYSKSGWGKDATHLYFNCQDRHIGHASLECNQFTVYKGGPLIIDSGARTFTTYDPDYYYNRLTIAKNTLLVYDPDERLAMRYTPAIIASGCGNVLNVGGQFECPHVWNYGGQYKNRRILDHGDLIAYENQPEFMYVCGNATTAYSYHKLRYFNRQIVHLRPDTVVVFDRVISKNPGFKKTFLLHTLNEPAVRGTEFAVYAERGLLYGRTLLPEGAVIATIGGPGKEFWVGEHALVAKPQYVKPGQDYLFRSPNLAPVFAQWKGDGTCDPMPEDKQRRLRKAFETMEAGAWRLEISPSQPAAKDFFLHVLHPMIPAKNIASPAEAFDAERVKTYPAARLVEEGDRVGAEIRLPVGALYRVLFDTQTRPGGHVTIKDVNGVTLVDRELCDYLDRTLRPK